MNERRERILAAAREMIGERGFDALTMRDLARASRVTVPTIYNLIGSKEQVLFAAVEDQTRRFVAGVERADIRAPEGRVLAVVESCVRELLRTPDYYRSLLKLLFRAPAAGAVRAKVSDAMAHELARGLDDLEAADCLLPWVVNGAVVDRVEAHLSSTALQWANGLLDDGGLRAASLYETSLTMIAVTRGSAREAFEKTARGAQSWLRVTDATDGPNQAGLVS